MPRDDKVRKSYDFLFAAARTSKTFSLAEISKACTWTPLNTRTNLSKRLSEFIIKRGSRYHVSPLIFQVPYSRYLDLFKQKNRIFGGNYFDQSHPNVTIYDFFLPLSLEDIMTRSLDDLFYADSISSRLKITDLRDIKQHLPKNSKYSNNELIQKCVCLIEQKISGYSINHVNGRFRAYSLLSKKEAFSRTEKGDQYIIDETTAVIRFILPHFKGVRFSSSIHKSPNHVNPFGDISLDLELNITSWIFRQVFVNAITSKISSQDEIWLLETGCRSQLIRIIAEDRN